MARKKLKRPAASPQVLHPLRGCQYCGGTGWVQTLHGQIIQRNIPGLKTTLEGRPTVERCSCTKPERRQEDASQPAPAGLDQAQRAAGEKEEA